MSGFPYDGPPPARRPPWRSCLLTLAIFGVMLLGWWVGVVWLWEKLT